MYAIALLRYRKPLDQVLKHIEGHRAYLGQLKKEGTLLASGPLEPRYGGALLLRIPDVEIDRRLDQIRDGDPFVKEGVAQYELLPWLPGIGKSDLDRL